MDDENRPLSSATIEIPDDGLIQVSDAEGEFAFDGLAPGEKVLQASSRGFQSKTAPLAVVAGETIQLTMSLSALNVSRLGVRTEQLRAYVACSFIVVVASIEEPCANSQSMTRFNRSFPTGWTALLLEADWTHQGVSTNPDFRVSLRWLEAKPYGVTVIHSYASVSAGPPVRIPLAAGQSHPHQNGSAPTPPAGIPGPLEIWFTKAPWRPYSVSSGIGATIGQPIDVYLSIFYEDATTMNDFSALPPRQ